MIRIEMCSHPEIIPFEQEVNDFLKVLENNDGRLIEIKYSTLPAEQFSDSMFTAMIIYEEK